MKRLSCFAMEKDGYVYIMASRRNGTLYLGATSDLPKRAYEYRNGLIDGFTRKYGCKMLVWYQASGISTRRAIASFR